MCVYLCAGNIDMSGPQFQRKLPGIILQIISNRIQKDSMVFHGNGSNHGNPDTKQQFSISNSDYEKRYPNEGKFLHGTR